MAPLLAAGKTLLSGSQANTGVQAEHTFAQGTKWQRSNVVPLTSVCVCVRGGGARFHTGNVAVCASGNVFIVGQPKLPFFASSTFFTSSRVGGAPSHPSQRRPTSLLPCHRSKFCKIPRLQCKRIDTGIKIATVPRGDRRKNDAKLSRRRNFPCKWSSASLNITAPAQKG